MARSASRRISRLVFLACAALCPLACDDDPQSHIYIAAPYDPSAACFGPSTSLAQIDTPDGDLDCAPTCLVLTTSTGAADVYVSTMCGPYPPGYDVSQTDPGCPAALAAWPAEQAALANGTSSCALSPSPPSVTDSGADAPND